VRAPSLHRAATGALALLLAASAGEAGAQTLQGAPKAKMPSLLPAGVTQESDESGGDPINGSFVLFGQQGRFPAGPQIKCGRAYDAELGGTMGTVAVKGQHYDLNTQVGKFTWDNLLQHAHPRTQLAAKFADVQSGARNGVIVKPVRRIPIEGGEAIIAEEVHTSNCTIGGHGDVTTHDARVEAYVLHAGTVVEISVGVMGLSGDAATAALQKVRATAAALRTVDWSKVK